MKKKNISIPLAGNDFLVERLSFSSGLSLILDNDELIKVEKSTNKHIFGLAVDLGTTSICASLCNLENREELAAATVANSQAVYGIDLHSRIASAGKSRKNQELLREAAVNSVNQAIEECILKSGVEKTRIYAMVVVGNPVMHHLLFQIPLPDNHPSASCRKLYQAKAGILGLEMNPDGNVRFLPGIDDFVGSDVLATMVGLQIPDSNDITIAVDVGFNGKIVIGSAKKNVVATTAVSSSLEGQLITSGMVARPGAIEWVRIEKGKVNLLTIGHIRPQGICGSGLIDALSELVREGRVSADGTLSGGDFVLYEDKKIRIVMTQDDVKKIQASKAAIHAGIELLMKKLNVAARDIKQVFLSGALGSYLNTENILRIGLIPAGFKDKISFVGNAAFAGAKQALLSSKECARMIDLAGDVQHVPLSSDKKFQKYFTQALPFSYQ
ncbi:MAG: ASKHA domain-containing protein [Candidatus Omnitrophica bacterium]|nr:ASKHA domain-containing protein [Candidatus Omnitrophota bacterium]